MTITSPTTINMSEGIFSIFVYLNSAEVTNFWFSRMLMLSIFVISFIATFKSKSDEDFPVSFAVASNIAFVIGLLFWLGNFIDSLTFVILLGLELISTIVILLDKRGDG